MERVLLWIDELDDCVAMWLHSPHRLRRVSLQAALAAALGLALLERLAPGEAPAGGLAGLAAAGVCLWAGTAAAELRAVRSAAPAGGRRLEMR